MNVYKVIVVLVLILFSLTASCAVERNAAEPPLSGFGFEVLLIKIEQVYDKIAELEFGIQKDRENTDKKFDSVMSKLNKTFEQKLNKITNELNHTISQNAITLQAQTTIATKTIQEIVDYEIARVTGAIDNMSERLDHNLTTLQSQSNVAIRKVEENINQKFARVNKATDQMSERMDHKFTSLQSQLNIVMRNERELIELKLATITGSINQLSGMTNQKLSEVISQLSQTIDQKLSGAVNTLGHKISTLHAKSNDAMEEQLQSELNSAIRVAQVSIERRFNEATSIIDELRQTIIEKLTAMQVEGKEELFKHMLWANHEQMRDEIEGIKSMEDFVRLKSQSGTHLQLISMKSCKDNPSQQSGKYILQSDTEYDIFLGYCKCKRGQNWLEIQRRRGGSVSFTRSWKDYRDGFGNIDGEHWIGLEILHKLTSARPHQLYVSLRDFRGNKKYALYSEFEIGSEAEHYALTKLGSYSGTAGDSLTYHKGMKFSTFDRDNDLSDKNCASAFKGGWWYKHCYESNLNGLYKQGNDWTHIVWQQYSSSYNNMGLGYARMYIREA